MIALPTKCLLKYSTAVANQLYFNIKINCFLTAALGLVNLSYRLHLFKCSLHGNKSPLNLAFHCYQVAPLTPENAEGAPGPCGTPHT